VTVDAANQAAYASGSFSVTLSRRFPGASWQPACATCTMAAELLQGGQHYRFEPRQFNTCGSGSAEFRALADSLQQVTETDESTNLKTASYLPPA